MEGRTYAGVVHDRFLHYWRDGELVLCGHVLVRSAPGLGGEVLDSIGKMMGFEGRCVW